jgi:hypothetical protein
LAALPNPNKARTPPPARRIDKKLVKKSTMAPRAASHSPSDRAMPTTHSGGTSDIEMATPANESVMSSRLMAKAAAVAIIAVIKGAMSMAPMTVAVESAMMPPLAMMVARKRRTVKRTRYGRRRAHDAEEHVQWCNGGLNLAC